MYSFNNKRGLGLTLTLAMALSLIPSPVNAAREDGLCSHHSVHTDDCGYSEDTNCIFALEGCTDCEQENSLISIIGTDVLIDGHSFPYTGQEIRPVITVTVAGKLLTEGEHYQLSYENNTEPGQASVTVTGLVEGGYQGIVTIAFTITPVSQPEDSETPGETEAPEDSQDPSEETQPVEYKITKGSGSTWYQGSGKHLSFTVNGKVENLKEVLVNGKALDKASYSAAEGTVLTLNKSYMNKLTVGKYTLTIRFADGEAEGIFHVSDRLDTSNPVTGDAVNPGLWVLAGAGSLSALGYMALMMSKKKKS